MLIVVSVDSVMFNRLASVLQELSGEEAPDGDPQVHTHTHTHMHP